MTRNKKGNKYKDGLLKDPTKIKNPEYLKKENNLTLGDYWKNKGDMK